MARMSQKSFKQKEMAKNGFGLHRQSIVAFDESSHRRTRNRQHTRARASQQTAKQSAATQ
jgi:hypothetical protein